MSFYIPNFYLCIIPLVVLQRNDTVEARFTHNNKSFTIIANYIYLILHLLIVIY